MDPDGEGAVLDPAGLARAAEVLGLDRPDLDPLEVDEDGIRQEGAGP